MSGALRRCPTVGSDADALEAMRCALARVAHLDPRTVARALLQGWSPRVALGVLDAVVAEAVLDVRALKWVKTLRSSLELIVRDHLHDGGAKPSAR